MDGGTKLSPAMEDYLKTILDLSEQEDAVRVTDIANRLNIAKASVAQALSVLKEQGFITQDRYGPVRLTPKGQACAGDVRYRRQAILHFLIKVLGVDPGIAVGDACQMEHAVSPETIKRLVSFLQANQYALAPNAAVAPLGVVDNAFRTLDTLAVGEKARIKQITGTALIRRRLLQMGLTPGTEVAVEGSAPLGDPVEIRVKGYRLSLRRGEAACVTVEPLDQWNR